MKRPILFLIVLAILQQIADREARSVSQLCEILLKLGVESYRKEGPKYLQRFLSRRKESPP